MIGGDLEYLISSLPYLRFDDSQGYQRSVSRCFQKYAGAAAKGRPIDRLLDQEAGKFLSQKDQKLFGELSLQQLHNDAYRRAGLPLLAAFSAYVTGLNEALKALRLARRKNNDPMALVKIEAPIEPGNPLQEELQLLKLQWEKLEELSALHYADLTALVAYKLKLLLLLRLWSFDAQKGYEVFTKTTKAYS